MNFQDFCMYLKKGIEDYLGCNTIVSLNHVVKNNGVSLEGLAIMEDGKNISPTIYLNGYYEEYQNGKSQVIIMRDILNLYEKSRVETNFDVEFFTDFEKVKGRIVYKLINYQKNQEILKEIPHRRIFDLAIVYYCLISNDSIGNATILIFNKHMDMWGVLEEDLFSISERNTERLLGMEIKNMDDIMMEMLRDTFDEKIGGDESRQMLESMKEDGKRSPMYVLTNREKMNGAICILYSQVLVDFAQAIGNDLFILPSSIHEVILVPAEPGITMEELERMVKEVNETQVEEEEVLSNRVYFFSRQSGKIKFQ